jgi:hypothetical protein
MLYSFKKLFQAQVEVSADGIQGAYCNIHVARFYSAQVNSGVIIKLLLRNFFFLTKCFDATSNFFKKSLIFYLRHAGAS